MKHEHKYRPSTTQFPVELEIGADNWSINIDGVTKLESHFLDIEQARSLIHEIFLDREVSGLETKEGQAILRCSGEVTVEMKVSPDPASGFLVAFDAKNGSTWESIDGELLSAC